MIEHLFEVSWEVCNKVGGINTVIVSKAALMKQQYGHYLLIGPYFAKSAQLELEQESPPPELKAAFDHISQQGIIARYGTWQVKGEPKVVLLDFSGFVPQRDKLKKELWDAYGIDSLDTQWEFDEPIIFSAAVAELLLALEPEFSGKQLCHCHEWMTGATLLFLKKYGSNIKSAFTTHATMLGRAICGSGQDLYGMLDNINPQEEAYKHGVQAKHLTERACAQTTDVFTTVSEITALEAEKLLGRKPEVLVLNGLDLERFPNIVDTSIRHVNSRDRLREFITYHFFPYYRFPLDHNLIFFIAGRPEFRNKGVDLTISALGKLNQLLKKEKNERTVTFFFWIPLGNGGIRMDILQSKNYYSHIKNYIDTNADEILRKVLYDMLAANGPVCETLFSKEFLTHVRNDLLLFRKEGKPPLTTHHLTWGEELLQLLLENGLDNSEETKVKVVAVPVYLDGNDGLFNLSYYDAIAGAHLGIFPSYYEPWGYTPLETAAMGVPAVTTDLAGFGRFITSHRRQEEPGIWVLNRQETSYDTAVDAFAKQLFEFCKLGHQERVQNKVAAREIAELCDWKYFIKNYVKAHELAFER